MNILKIEKPLIEWEKELDVWLIDLNLKDHLVSYNKIDAFDKIFVSNVRRGWSSSHYDLYYTILLNKSLDTLVLNEFNDCFKYDNTDAYEEKALIEWEKEYNVWVSDLSVDEHFKKYYRYRADSKLKKYLNIYNWNSEAQAIYDSYKGVNKNTDIDDERSVKKDNNIINNSVDKKDNHKIFKSVKNRKCRNRKKISNSIIKKSVALAVAITSISTLALANLFLNNNNYDDEDVYAYNTTANSTLLNASNSLIKHLNMEDNDDVELGNSSVADNVSLELNNAFNIKSNLIDDSKKDNSLDNNIVNNNFELNNSAISNELIDASKIDNKEVNDIEKDKLDSVEEEIINFKVGETVSVNDDADIYSNCYDAMNDCNGLDPYYSYDYDRVITGVCLNSNGNIIYSVDNSEIDNYVNDGAYVVSYSTMVNNVDEGFYESDNIKKLRKQI